MLDTTSRSPISFLSYPDDYLEQPVLEEECNYCGESCEGIYCDKECKKAYESEN